MPDSDVLWTAGFVLLTWLGLWWLAGGRRPFTLRMCRALVAAWALIVVGSEPAGWRAMAVVGLIMAVSGWGEAVREKNRTEETKTNA